MVTVVEPTVWGGFTFTPAVPIVDTAGGGGIQNILINGDIMVDQQFFGVQQVGIPTGTYVADQWEYDALPGSGAGKFNSQAIIDLSGIGSGYGDGLVSRLDMFVNTQYNPVVANDFFLLCQPFEGLMVYHLDYGKSTAKTSTVLFWCRSTIPGNYTVSIRNTIGSRTFIHSFAHPGGAIWRKYAVVVPGDTIGGWAITTAKAGDLCFSLGSGSSFISPLVDVWQPGNFIQHTGDVQFVNTPVFNFFSIGGVEWKAGIHDVNEIPERLPYEMQVRRCMRYWHSMFIAVPAFASITNVFLNPRMRVPPIVTGGGAGFIASVINSDIVHVGQIALSGQQLTFNSRM